MQSPVTPAPGPLEPSFAAALAQQIFEPLKRLIEERRPADQPGEIKPRLLSLEETATYIGRSTQAVRLLIHRGKLPVTKIDGKVQVDRISLDKFIDSCTYFET